MRLISVSTQASKRSHASFETSTTERACVVPCPSKGFVSSPDLRQSVEMSNMQTQFTEQFFVTPTSHHSRHNQVSAFEKKLFSLNNFPKRCFWFLGLAVSSRIRIFLQINVQKAARCNRNYSIFCTPLLSVSIKSVLKEGKIKKYL